MRRPFFIIIALLSCISAYAGPATVKGKVVDSTDNLNAPGVNVLIKDKDGAIIEYALTDTSGMFKFDALKPQEIVVEIGVIGYMDFISEPVTLKEDEILDMGVVFLKPYILDDSEVIVYRDGNVVTKLGKQVIQGTSATSSGGTALDVLSSVPSVLVNADGDLTLRGSGNFLVYVDGKPSPLEGTEALRAVPASSIDNIEIITTPSARYKTDGDAGIINIITRTSSLDAWSGTISTSESTLGTWGGEGLLNYKTGHHRFYIGGTAQDIKTKSDFLQDKETLVDGYRTISNSDGYRYRTFKTMVAKAGWEYDDRKAHDIRFEIQAGGTKNTRGGYMLYKENRAFEGSTISDQTYDAHDHYILKKTLYQASLDYTWKIADRSSLSLSNRLRYDPYSLEYTESNLHDLKGVRAEGTRGFEEEHHWDADGSLAFTQGYSKSGLFEAGWQYTTYSEHGGYTFKSWVPEKKDFIWDESLDIPFYYRRQVHTLYAMVTDKPGRWEYDLGVRGEEVIDVMDIEMEGASRHRKRFELYPSAHLGYMTDVAGTFSIGYSRRTNRPGIWKLEPYITYEDYYTRIVGNPDLGSEYINSFELGWKSELFHKCKVSATAYLRSRSDVVDVIRLPYQPGVTLDKIVNAGDQTDTGIEGMATVAPLPWWTSSTLTANVFHYSFNAGLEECSDASGFSYMAGWINVFRPTRKLTVQFDSHLVGPSTLTQGNEKAYCFFDLGARLPFAKDHVVLSLTAHDIFHTAKYESFRNTLGLDSHTIVRPSYPTVMFGLTFSFNSKPKEHNGAINKEAAFDGKDF